LGDLLQFDGSGRLEQAIAVSTAWTSQLIAGWSLENALNDQSAVKTSAGIAIAVPDQTIWALPLYSATPANAVWNSNLIGNKYGIYNSSSGFPCVNFDDTSNVKVRVLGVDPNDDSYWPNYTTSSATTQYPKVYVTPLSAACFLSGTR
jgi:hypothetical protein